MSYIFSRALAEESSPAIFSDIAVSEPSNACHTVSECSCSASETEHCQRSQYSATSGISMVDPTEAALMSWLEGFPAKPTAAHLEDARWLTISGRRCDGSWQMSLPGTFLPRTRSDAQSTLRPTTLKRWATPSDVWLFPRQTWVLTTFGKGTGFLHTPTHTANYACRSMQKWPNCREFVRVFGKPTPTNHEWMMGIPLGWSALKPLEMRRFQSWLLAHGKS